MPTHSLPRALTRHVPVLAPLACQAVIICTLAAGHATAAAVIALFAIALLAVVSALAHGDRAARITQLQFELADANTDPVTELPVRRIAEAHVAATDQATRLTVAVADVDGMHDVNNSYGHQVGDAYLHGIAGRLQQAAGAGDMVARLGGDEFVIITTRTPQDLAQALAAAIRQPLTIDQRTLPLRLSIGICHFDGSDAHTLFGCADLAMYTAKRSGSFIEHYDIGRDGTPLPHGVRPAMRHRDYRTISSHVESERP